MNNNWIKIKDGLPDKNSWVFVCYNFVSNDAFGMGLDKAYYDGTEWMIGNKHRPYSVRGNVTHWMELPELPS